MTRDMLPSLWSQLAVIVTLILAIVMIVLVLTGVL